MDSQVLEFRPRVIEDEEQVDTKLSHVSLQFHSSGLRVKEERGLDEFIRTFTTEHEINIYFDQIKQDIIKHLQERN